MNNFETPKPHMVKPKKDFKIKVGNMYGLFFIQIEHKDPKQIEALHAKIKEWLS